MPTAVIVDAIRTPLGRRNGQLAGLAPGRPRRARARRALVVRNDLDPALVDDVIMGCVSQVGEQALNIGRNALLAAGFPDSVPGTTVDRQCGSSQQALHFAAQGVMAGAYDVVIAAGVESMSRVPMGSSVLGADPFGTTPGRALPDLVPQGISAELIAEKWGSSREELDEFALALAAAAPRRPPPRRASTARSCRCRSPSTATPTVMTATRASGPTPPSSGSPRSSPRSSPTAWSPRATRRRSATARPRCWSPARRRPRALGLTPRARLRAFALAGDDPILMLTAPIPATGRGPRAGRPHPRRVDRIEINEAFASVVLAWAQRGPPRHGPGQRERRCHRARSPARGVGCPPHGHAALRARAQRRALRAAAHVRGRRAGQRHRVRAALAHAFAFRRCGATIAAWRDDPPHRDRRRRRRSRST